MKKTIITCDIEKCNNDFLVETKDIQVIFTTDQTEGRSCTPYLSNEKVDICVDCLIKVLEGNYIWANGAQGHNTYYFKK